MTLRSGENLASLPDAKKSTDGFCLHQQSKYRWVFDRRWPRNDLLARLLRRRIVFGAFPRRSNYLVHSFLNLVDLGMHFLDEVMLNLRQVFNSFPLLAKLVQKVILFGRNPVHPPKANSPANGADQSQPKSSGIPIHNLSRYPAAAPQANSVTTSLTYKTAVCRRVAKHPSRNTLQLGDWPA
jgi:hypothetical protein